MRKLWAALAIIVVVAAGAACDRDQPQVSTEAGRKLYLDDCASCHGNDGSGGRLVGAAVSSDLRAQKLGEAYGFNMALVRRAILDGKNPNGDDLDPAMPRFRGKLSESDATNIIVFMQSLRAPPATEPPESDH